MLPSSDAYAPFVPTVAIPPEHAPFAGARPAVAPPLPPPPSSPQQAYERAFRTWSNPNVSDLVDLAEDRSSGRLSYQVFTAADLPSYRPSSERAAANKASLVSRMGLALVAAATICLTVTLVKVADDDTRPSRARAAAVAAFMPAAMQLPAPAVVDAPAPVVDLDDVTIPEAPPARAAVKPPAKAKPRILVPKNPYE